MFDDDYLVIACQSGDVNAFEDLVRKYQNRIIRVLYLLLSDSDDAQDVAQETFIRAFKSIKSFRCGSSFSTWIHRIAINSARNWIRDNKRYRDALPIDGDIRCLSPDAPEDIFIMKERSVEIWSALRSLPYLYREAIVLRHYDELSYEEIALVQQVPVGTVRSRLFKGRELLREYLLQSTNQSERRGVVD